MAPKKHTGKKQSRRMRGGMTTGEWGTAVYGGSDAQHAVGNGSNVISMRYPNSEVLAGAAPAPQMKGGRKLKGGDLLGTVAGMFTPAASGETPPASDETPPASGETPPAPGMFDGLFKSESASTEEAPAEPASTEEAPAAGGKGKRKSATKRRKSHKKKGKSSKKRAHKRH